MVYMYKAKEDKINVGREDSIIQCHLGGNCMQRKRISMISLVYMSPCLYAESLHVVPLPPNEPKISMTFLSKDIKKSNESLDSTYVCHLLWFSAPKINVKIMAIRLPDL